MNRFNPTTYIDKDPPLDQSPQSMIDYLAYLKEQINFIMNNLNKRISAGGGGDVKKTEIIADINASTETQAIVSRNGFETHDGNDVTRTVVGTDGTISIYDTDGTLRQRMNGPNLTQYGPAAQNGVKRTELDWGDVYTYNSSGVQGFHVNGAGQIYPLQSTQNYIADFAYSRVSPSGWRVVRWNSGWAECWYYRTYTGAVSTAWGNCYASASISSVNYPVTFTSVPYEQVTLAGSSSSGSSNASGWVCQSGGTSGPTTTKSGQYQIVRPNSSASGNYTMVYHVAGWTS